MKTANKIVMTAAGLVLITAAVLKVHQLLTEPILSRGFWESWAFLVMQIPLELGLGIWLVCGLFRKAGWLLGLLAFGLFIGVTLQKGISGAASCGCFGKVHVNPWITVSAIDVPFFIALLIFRPRGGKFLPPPWPSAKRFFGVAIPTFILLGSIVPVLIFNRPAEKTSKYEVLKPQGWTDGEQAGKEWPLLKHIDICESLKSKIVVVLLYRYDCPNCHEAIPEYKRFSNQMRGNNEAIQFAFVEIPPYGPARSHLIPASVNYLSGRLDTSKDWYIATPLVVLLRDGSVVKSWEVNAPSLDEILEAAFSGG